MSTSTTNAAASEKRAAEAKAAKEKAAKAKARSGKEPPQKAETEKKEVSKVPAFMKPYVKAYPKEKAFLVTSDRQVFFVRDSNAAGLHQKSLKGGEIKTINV